jgi:hypothetical protein
MSKSKKSQSSGTYADVEFYIDDRWKFYIPSLDRSYDDYGQMTAAITRSQEAEKAVARRRPMAIPIVTNKLEQLVITGIHAGHGHFVTKPKCDELSYRQLYVDVQWIREALAEVQRLEARRDHINDALSTFQLYDSKEYRFDPGKSLDRHTAAEDAAAKALKAAEKTDLDNELLKTAPRKSKLRF